MKTFFSMLVSCCFFQSILAQDISINATGAPAHPSAILDVSASNKGMLVPRTSTSSRIAIANPAKGLLLYDTSSNSFWYHNGNTWIELIAGGSITAAGPWSANGINIYNANTGNVGIGTNSPFAKLTVQTPINSAGFRHVGGADSIIVSEDIGGISASIGTATNHAFRLNAGGKGRMSIFPTGEIVAGDNGAASFGKFTVSTLNNNYGISHTGEGGNVLATRMGGTSAGIGTFSATNMRIFSNSISRILIAEATGNVGIGTDDPANKLQIGSLGATGFNGNDLAIGNGAQALGIFQSNTVTSFGSSTDITFQPRVFGGAGNVGINVAAPVNKLQIGSMGSATFNGNDLAIGNGAQAMVINQTNNSTVLASTTDIVLQPRYNGQGRVGINTNTPRAPLDIVGVSTPPPLFSVYSYLNESTWFNGVFHANPTESVPNISIIASGNVYAHEFDAYSDARIKEVAGLSNAPEDLKTMCAIQVKNYTMKDKAIYGHKIFKKVIAQQIEKVYPQIVSKHTDFIPNVYQLTNSITKIAGGCLLHFSTPHHLDSNAKRIQAMASEKDGMQQFTIISVPSPQDIIIEAADLTPEKMFVYGQEVNDFRTVDYEGLTTLNISATQEIYRLVKKQAAIISKQQRQIERLERNWHLSAMKNDLLVSPIKKIQPIN